MPPERRRKVERILELRRKLVEMAGYTAGVEFGDMQDLPDAFWERAAQHYARLLLAERLVDDVTDDEIREIEDSGDNSEI